MRKNLRLLTPIDHRRRLNHRHVQHRLFVEPSSRSLSTNFVHPRSVLASSGYLLRWQPLSRSQDPPRRVVPRVVRPLVTTKTRSRTHPSLERIRFRTPSLRYLSSIPEATNNRSSWNERTEEFLERSLASSGSQKREIGDVVPEQLSPDETAETIQVLLDDLLQITAAKINYTQKGAFPHTDSDDPRGERGHNNSSFGDYLDWRTTELSLSSYTSTPSDDDTQSESQHSVQDMVDETIDAGLAFALIDRLVALEQADDATLINYTVQWGTHTNCLNPILQLWKESYSPSNSHRSKLPKTNGSEVLVPSKVLAKLDFYRQKSNILVPDVQSYNIILDAVATHNNHNGKSARSKQKSPVDIGFCQSLWEWMWTESNQDSVVRPDGITLRIMLKAHVLTGHELAPQRCETLVDEWGKYQNNRQNLSASKDGDNEDHHSFIHDPKGTLLQSLVHVWALHNPQVAESYLMELARRYLSGEAALPPDTIAWNRVVSAYAIAHGKPAKGLRVLEAFWKFYRQAHGLDNTTSSIATNRSKPMEAAADSVSVNTKSNSLQLLNAAAIARKNEELIDPVSSAIDNAIWKVHPPNLETYNALLEGYARQNNAREANKLFERVQNAASMSPDVATFTSAIKANGSNLEKVKDLAQQCLDAYKRQEEDQENTLQDNDRTIKKQKGIHLDRAFFHAWLNACAKAQNVKEAKAILKEMKSFNVTPNATTYRMLINAFLSQQDLQGAIEWLLAYAKLEGMTESAIVSCTTTLLEWYRQDESADSSGEVDAMVLLQILCENNFITQEESVQQLLLGISATQGRAVMGWLGGTKGRTLKQWSISLRALSQETTNASEVEDFFLQLQEDPLWKKKFDPTNRVVFDEDDKQLVAEMYSSIIIAWCKQGKLDKQSQERIQFWTEELENSYEGKLSLNLAAQVALVTLYCRVGKPAHAEQYVNELQSAFDKGKSPSPPDTIMCNMVLNAWAQNGNGSRAAKFFDEQIQEPDAVSYNTVINAFARQGRIDKAEDWVCKLIDSFIESSVESLRPQQATFTVLLAAWRRSRSPRAAERAEKILVQMQQLYDNDILLSKPNVKSYQTVLDTWGKSRDSDAAQRAEELVLSSPDFKDNKRLWKKIKDIKSQQRKMNRKPHKEAR